MRVVSYEPHPDLGVTALVIEFSESEIWMLDKVAKALGVSIQDLIRDAIYLFIGKCVNLVAKSTTELKEICRQILEQETEHRS